jgi:hypothetical protein
VNQEAGRFVQNGGSRTATLATSAGCRLFSSMFSFSLFFFFDHVGVTNVVVVVNK